MHRRCRALRFSDMAPGGVAFDNASTAQHTEPAVINRLTALATAACLAACLNACQSQDVYDPLADYEPVNAVTQQRAPEPGPVADEAARRVVDRGRYLTELLGCGSCHTDGALIGSPRADRALAGSRVGIAYTNPLQYDDPGVVYAPNLTPDDETGIGRWSDEQIVAALREGQGRHGRRPILVMPWQAYTTMRYDDAYAIAKYLQSLAPVRHQVPAEVAPGQPAAETYVHFGVYQKR